jgi:hypothetical protein
MKSFKFILFLFISIAFLSCGDDDKTPAYVLSNENIAGSYNISNLSVSTDITTTTNNISIKVATASTEGDLFQVDVKILANGTYSMKGSYTTIYRLTPVTGQSVETRNIINIDNSGDFTINPSNNSITFSSGIVEGLFGTLEVQVFNENSFSLFQEIDIPVGNNIEKATTNIGFIRK